MSQPVKGCKQKTQYCSYTFYGTFGYRLKTPVQIWFQDSTSYKSYSKIVWIVNGEYLKSTAEKF